MDAFIVQLAQGVEAALKAASLSFTPTVKRSYLPVRKLEQMGVLEVIVGHAGLDTKTADRSPSHQHDYTIDLAIQKRLDLENPEDDAAMIAACDPLMAFVQEVMDLFRGRGVTGLAGRFISAQNKPLYGPELLDREQVFGSVVALTFRTIR